MSAVNVDPTNLTTGTGEFRPLIDEQRRQPRIVIDLPIHVGLDDGQSMQCVVHDISRDALQLRCRPSEARRLLRKTSDVRTRVQVRFHLPCHVGPLNLEARCRVVHATESDDGEMAVGLEFEKFSRVGARILNVFITESQQPAVA